MCVSYIASAIMYICHNCTQLAGMLGTSRYICSTCLRPAVMSLFSYPTNGMVSKIAPDHQPCKLQFHLTSSHVFISFILSAYMSVTVSSYQYPCILHLHPTISHACNNCIPPFAMSFKVAPNQQSCLLDLHLQACMSDTLAPDQHSYLL